MPSQREWIRGKVGGNRYREWWFPWVTVQNPPARIAVEGGATQPSFDSEAHDLFLCGDLSQNYRSGMQSIGLPWHFAAFHSEWWPQWFQDQLTSQSHPRQAYLHRCLESSSVKRTSPLLTAVVGKWASVNCMESNEDLLSTCWFSASAWGKSGSSDCFSPASVILMTLVMNFLTSSSFEPSSESSSSESPRSSTWISTEGNSLVRHSTSTEGDSTSPVGTGTGLSALISIELGVDIGWDINGR